MKCLVIIAAVVLICQSAKVPEEITHQVSVTLPGNVLAPSLSSSKDVTKTEVPAQVVEIAKNHKHMTEVDKKVVDNTDKPVVIASVEAMKRKTRDVMTTVQPEVKNMMPVVQVPQVDKKTVVMATMQPDTKSVMPTVTEMNRKTGDVMTTVQPEVKNAIPVVQVPQINKKTVVMATMQPDTNSVMPTVTELKRKTRDVMTTVQPEVKNMMLMGQVPQVDKKTVVMATMQPEMKTAMPTVTEMKRKTRSIMTTVQPEVKNVMPLVQMPQVDKKTVVMATMQPDTKSVVPTVTEISHKINDVVTTVEPEVKNVMPMGQVPQVDKKTVVMATMQTEMKTVMPTVTEMKRKTRSIMTTIQPEVKNVMPTVQVPQVDKKTVVMTTMRPESKSVMSTVTETERKTRSVPFKDNESKKSRSSHDHNHMNAWGRKWSSNKPSIGNKIHSHRYMRSVKDETTTQVPISSVQPVTVKEVVVTTSDSSKKSTGIDPCDLLCTKFEFEPICASNGLCLHEFPNQCILETFNCKHPEGKFAATKDDSCQMSWLNKCDENDML